MRGEEDEGRQDQEEQEDSDSSGPDSSGAVDVKKARNRGNDGTPCSSRSRWTPSSSANQRKRKEWVVISEIPKEDRPPDFIHREICNMLTHELAKADHRIPTHDPHAGKKTWGGWKEKDISL